MNTMDKIQNDLLRRFHTLCSRLGLADYEKRAIIESYGVESSADIDTHDLVDICAALSKRLDKKGVELDKLRKRAIASINGYLKKAGQETNIDIIKAVACRATGYPSFNKIPAERLRNIYYAFTNKQKDIDTVEVLARSVLAGAVKTGNNPIIN